MNTVQLIWEWYVFLFVVLVFIPALKFPFVACAVCLAAATWGIWKGTY